MPLMIVVELADTAPMKTFTIIQRLEGVISVHMNERPAAEVKRLLREAPSEETRSAKPRGKPMRTLLMDYLLKHTYALYKDLGLIAVENGNAAGSVGATLNKMKNDGDVTNGESGWSLTAKGRKAAA